MRIRIIGGVGSGKTYFSKRVAKEHDLHHIVLDDFVWDNDAEEYCAKKPPKERDRLLKEALKKKRWVVDGVYYEPWVKETFIKADLVIGLRVPKAKRYYRVLKRYIRAKLKGEFVPERSLKDVFTIFKLDKGWTKGIKKASRKAKVFKKAEHALKHVRRHVRGKR